MTHNETTWDIYTYKIGQSKIFVIYQGRFLNSFHILSNRVEFIILSQRMAATKLRHFIAILWL